MSEESNALPPLWTPEGLAQYLDVPLATVYRWRHLGTGPVGIRVGKHVRFSDESVREWLAQRTDKPDAA